MPCLKILSFIPSSIDRRNVTENKSKSWAFDIVTCNSLFPFFVDTLAPCLKIFSLQGYLAWKPNLIFYGCLSYHEDNVRLLEENFTCQMLPDPSFVNEDVLEHVEYLAAPLGYKLTAQKINQCKKLKAIFSNTTGIPHIDVDLRNRKVSR